MPLTWYTIKFYKHIANKNVIVFNIISQTSGVLVKWVSDLKVQI